MRFHDPATVQHIAGSVVVKADAPTSVALQRYRTAAAICTLWTVAVVAIHGYHPYAEDGGIYLAGIKKTLFPGLYPQLADFQTEFSRFSLFSRGIAALVHWTSLDLMSVMLVAHLASIWLTLYAAWQLAVRCSCSRAACCGAVSLFALCLTMPVAGTSLILMDPYVTARSLSTPCSLFALTFLLDAIRNFKHGRAEKWRSLVLCVISVAIAAAIHPLMAIYALECLTLLACASLSNLQCRSFAIVGACAAGLLIAACIYLLSPLQTAAYVQAEQSRDYWFVDTWRWYQLAGLIAPPLVIAMIFLRPYSSWSKPRTAIAQMAIAAGFSGIVAALLFARTSSASYAVARLQPLRVFQLIYVIMILAIGIFVGEQVLKQHRWRWAALVLALGGLMFYVQRQTFPHSAHLEFPWNAPENGWEQGFVWIRENTPKDAVFALDFNYIFARGEDAQVFSAIAERSALPDYAKDGGIAAITPSLAAEWLRGKDIQSHLNDESDAERVAHLRPAGITWIVLPGGAVTGFPCVYANGSMKLCRVE